MRAPDFWRHMGLAPALLAPLQLVTRLVTARRVARPGYRAPIAVFCAGNASVGGSGKTILARDILRRVPGAYGLTRGYGGRLQGPVLVDLAHHDAGDVGDEALLLAATAPTILARDRAAGARLAHQLGASAVVMDDGLQNPGLVKDFAFLVVDGGYGFGNGCLLPAGPLREKVATAASRCVAAVLIGDDRADAARQLPASLPVLRATLEASCEGLQPASRVLAFAGIGRPEKFFESVAVLGFEIAAQIKFDDHYTYTQADALMLQAGARAHGAQLVTTEKDYVKLPPALRAETAIVRVQLRWQDDAAFMALLRTEAP